MQRSQPFARARLMMAAVAAIMAATTGNLVRQQSQLAELSPYESRGHGKGGRQRAPHGAQMANIRAARKQRNQRRARIAARGGRS